MNRCPNCGSVETRAIEDLSSLERCLDCGTLLHRGERSAPSPTKLLVRPGVSPFHVVLAALRELQDVHGAVVEEVDVGPRGGSFVLKVPIPDDESDELDLRRSLSADADE